MICIFCFLSGQANSGQTNYLETTYDQESLGAEALSSEKNLVTDQLIDSSYEQLTLSELQQLKERVFLDLEAVDYIKREDVAAIKRELLIRLSNIENILQRYPIREKSGSLKKWVLIFGGTLACSAGVYVLYKHYLTDQETPVN